VRDLNTTTSDDLEIRWCTRGLSVDRVATEQVEIYVYWSISTPAQQQYYMCGNGCSQTHVVTTPSHLTVVHTHFTPHSSSYLSSHLASDSVPGLSPQC
jgi:hypothetical protein